MTFKEECELWLLEFGYTIHAASGDSRWFLFTTDDHYSPTIICRIDNDGKKSCEIQGGHTLKMFISLKAENIMFKHPDIKKFIAVFRHYEIVCVTHPPF